MRAKIKKELVDVAAKTGNNQILEARSNQRANHEFHEISDAVRQEVGLPVSERVFPLWQKWLNEQVKLKKI